MKTHKIIAASLLALTTVAGAALAQTSPDAPAETPITPEDKTEPETSPPPTTDTTETTPTPPSEPGTMSGEPAMPSESGTATTEPPTPSDTGTTTTEPPTTPEPSSTGSVSTAECPSFLRGAKLNVTDAKDGASITITTDNDANVPLLRDLVSDVADTVETKSKEKAKSQQKTKTDTAQAKLDLTTRDIEGGAQVTVSTEEPDQIAQVREQAKGLHSAWTSSSCAEGTTPEQTSSLSEPVAPEEPAPPAEPTPSEPTDMSEPSDMPEPQTTPPSDTTTPEPTPSE